MLNMVYQANLFLSHLFDSVCVLMRLSHFLSQDAVYIIWSIHLDPRANLKLHIWIAKYLLPVFGPVPCILNLEFAV